MGAKLVHMISLPSKGVARQGIQYIRDQAARLNKKPLDRPNSFTQYESRQKHWGVCRSTSNFDPNGAKSIDHCRFQGCQILVQTGFHRFLEGVWFVEMSYTEWDCSCFSCLVACSFFLFFVWPQSRDPSHTCKQKYLELMTLSMQCIYSGTELWSSIFIGYLWQFIPFIKLDPPSHHLIVISAHQTPV